MRFLRKFRIEIEFDFMRSTLGVALDRRHEVELGHVYNIFIRYLAEQLSDVVIPFWRATKSGYKYKGIK